MEEQAIALIIMYVGEMHLDPLNASFLGEQLGGILIEMNQVESQQLLQYKNLFIFKNREVVSRKHRRRLQSATVVFLCRLIVSTMTVDYNTGCNNASIRWAWSVIEFIEFKTRCVPNSMKRRNRRISWEINSVTVHVLATMHRCNCDCFFYLPNDLLE